MCIFREGKAKYQKVSLDSSSLISFQVATGDYRVTANWVRGVKVKGAAIPFGTAIATFPNGKYSGHTAIYTGQNVEGIQVWDQWVGHSVSQRTIRWNGARISNNGDSFYVIN